MINSIIHDGSGRNTSVRVEDEGLLVSNFTSPPLLPQKVSVYNRFFTDDGLTSGSNDLGIDGSAASVEYWIPADDENDYYVTTLSFILGYGSSAEMYEFADSAAALANGVLVEYKNNTGDTTTIINPKTNYSFMRASMANYTNTNWETRGFAGAGDYGFFSTVHLEKMLPPYGIKLDKGSAQRISITIRDDCTDADLFNCFAFGFKRFE